MIKVIYTSHRVENLPFFEKEIENVSTVILEEPRNEILSDAIEGKISLDTYVSLIDTPFPVYTSKLIEMLRKHRDKNILQIEPYLEEVEKLQRFKDGNEKVREMERKVNLAWLDYTEAFMKKEFDKIIESVINFAKADAERFIMRDVMRAEVIKKYDSAVVEAGLMHTKLAEILEAETLCIPLEIARILNVEYLENPGNVLTKSYIYGFDCKEELLAARSLIYVSLVEKKELLPTPENPYPHFINEQKIIRFVNKLDYDKCKKIFEKLWYQK